MSERSFVFEVIIFRIVGLLYLIRCLIRNLNFSEQLVIDFKFSLNFNSSLKLYHQLNHGLRFRLLSPDHYSP